MTFKQFLFLIKIKITVRSRNTGILMKTNYKLILPIMNLNFILLLITLIKTHLIFLVKS